MRIIYTAGLISTDFPESLRWRDEAANMLQEHAVVLSPLRSKSSLGKQTRDGGVTDPNRTSAEIVLRDYADVVLAHLENFGSPRPLIGTIAELAWAWEKRIPVVAVARPVNVLMRTHPFISQFVTRYTESVEEAVSNIIEYWLKN